MEEIVYSIDSLDTNDKIPGDIRSLLRFFADPDNNLLGVYIWADLHWIYILRGIRDLWSAREIGIMTQEMAENGIVDSHCVFLLDKTALPSTLATYDDTAAVIILSREDVISED